MDLSSQALDMEETARKMVSKPKGILAADESHPTMAKRFQSVGVENTPENRQAYRETLFATHGLGKYISGVILFTETLGVPVNVELLKKQGIIVGVKVDLGKEDYPGGQVTLGLDKLDTSLPKYKEQGARFTKWRAVITVEFSEENSKCLKENARRLAEYAKICQDHCLVPIVEPEVLMDGSHSIDDCYKKTDETLDAVFSELKAKRVNFKAMVLKPNMVLPGKESGQEMDHKLVAWKTLDVLKKHVPEDVPGIAFLSGGQSDEDAGKNLSELNKLEAPWNLTFSYGRALLRESLKMFAAGDKQAVMKALLEKAEGYSRATRGEY